ncbi:hypothetical protein GCM10023176_06540 [Micromonospora coerulea]|uniref:RCK N-terminal domain-containing protein n=1 Tax=Micromonospora coerulea TaxID=47856 RepID=A0ABP8S6A3_9ACTN
MGAAVALFLMGAGRAARRERRHQPVRNAEPCLVYGVDEAGERLVRVLLGDPGGRYLPVGLLDDHPGHRDLRLAGLRVLGGREQLAEAVRRTGARTVIFSMSGSDAELMRDVRSRTLQAGAAFKVLPPVPELLDRPVAVTDVRDMQITDLLDEVRGLDPYGDPDELIKRLAMLCAESAVPLTAVPGPR